jgi:hypothetical protein
MEDGRVRTKINGKGRLTYRLAIEKLIGRTLKPSEVVHHIDSDPRNDNPKNLFVFRNQSAHFRWHHFLRRHGLHGLLESNLLLLASNA